MIKPIHLKELSTLSGIILPGEQKAGENLLFGRVVHPGDTHFKTNQEVFFSEYSSAAIADARLLLDGKGKVSKEDGLVIVAADDIMAYYDDVREVSETTKED